MYEHEHTTTIMLTATDAFIHGVRTTFINAINERVKYPYNAPDVDITTRPTMYIHIIGDNARHADNGATQWLLTNDYAHMLARVFMREITQMNAQLDMIELTASFCSTDRNSMITAQTLKHMYSFGTPDERNTTHERETLQHVRAEIMRMNDEMPHMTMYQRMQAIRYNEHVYINYVSDTFYIN